MDTQYRARCSDKRKASRRMQRSTVRDREIERGDYKSNLCEVYRHLLFDEIASWQDKAQTCRGLKV